MTNEPSARSSTVTVASGRGFTPSPASDVLRPREPEGEHGFSRFVGDVHRPVVARPEVGRALAVAKHLAAALERFSANGSEVGKLRPFVIRIVPAVIDVEEVARHRALPLCGRAGARASLSHRRPRPCRRWRATVEWRSSFQLSDEAYGPGPAVPFA